MPVGKEETIAVKSFQYSKTISGLVVYLHVIPKLEYFLECFFRTDLNENGRWQFQVPQPPAYLHLPSRHGEHGFGHREKSTRPYRNQL